MYRNRENRGEIRNFGSITKKRSSDILADENREIFRERYNLENFPESGKFSKIGGGNLKQGGKCIMASGGWTPLHQVTIKVLVGTAILACSFIHSFIRSFVHSFITLTVRSLFPNMTIQKCVEPSPSVLR